ncbi:MAG TPA: ELWxxDGT repeat protein, partial [Thermoanaerobaculia bacterium]|nr:ELWxxDGT repeat protein [Thermoanaerobaculia bacterium]
MHRRTSLALLLGLLATSGFAEAQPARLVKDLNIQQQFPLSSREALESEGVGDVFYFVFDDRIHGEELWKTDGTPGGASLVEDICPGACSSFPRALTASNGRLFFAAHDGDLGWRLWKSDGTPQGTSMVTALASMEEFETHLLDAGGTLYFSAADASHGPELWVTDGTAEGTRRVTDIPSGPFSWWPRPMAAGQGLVLFAAEDAAHGYEPWVTDGTKEGTRMLGDLAPGSSRSVFLHSGVQQAVAAPWGGFLFGAASFEGNELWATDGTPQGTSMVKNIKLDGHSDPHGFTAVNGRVVFVAEDSQRGIEPWVSDGTPEGTVLLKDIWPGMDGSYPRELTAVGNQVFFRASEMTLGSELWATDGTPAGTRLVKDIAPGSSAFFSHHRYGFSNLEGRLVFFAYPTLGLWESDGTAAGTRPIAPGDWPSPYSIDMQDGYGIAGGRLFFRSGSWGHEIWATDGSEAGPVQLESFFELSSAFWPQNGKLQPPGNFAAYGDVLLFLGSDGLTAGELWRSDGSGPGTWALKDLTPDGSPSIPHSFLPVNGRMVFRAAGGLGVTDGTPEGTELLPPKGTTAVARLGSEVFALTLDNENPGLWKTDGTLAGTVPAAEISNSDLGLPSELVASGGKLFIKTFLDRLWVSDGTQAGTYLLETGGDNPVNLVDSGGTLFFTAGTNAAGSELWKSNGTPEGTFMVKDIRPGP